MTTNLEHNELGFLATQSELEAIYQFYATQKSATKALSAPKNAHQEINGEIVHYAITPGHDSVRNDIQSAYGKKKIDVDSEIIFKLFLTPSPVMLLQIGKSFFPNFINFIL